MLKWEELDHENFMGIARYTYRTKVPGGWLIMCKDIKGKASGITFYPDPNHEWDGNSI